MGGDDIGRVDLDDFARREEATKLNRRGIRRHRPGKRLWRHERREHVWTTISFSRV